MSTTTVTVLVNASVETVFEVISDMENYSKAVPHIVNVEFLTESKAGLGTRFRETRMMHGKEASTELEVTEFKQNELIRMVSDQGGTIWDSVFMVKPKTDGSELTLQMDARPYKLMAKLITPLISKMIKNAIIADMESVKSYCESLS